MLQTNHRFVLELRTVEGRSLARVRLQTDCRPACEWTEFALRRKAACPGDSLMEDMTLEPLPNAELGSPYARGFRIQARQGEVAVACDFPVAFFKHQATAAARQLIAKGLLKDGDSYLYLLLAYPEQGEQPRRPSEPSSFRVAAVAQPLSLREAVFAEWNGARMNFGEITETDIPVYIPQMVMQQAARLAEQAGKLETGGILIGHLYHDSTLPDLAAVATAQIPVQHAEAKSQQLVFTPETWSSVRAAIQLRDRGEMMIGWWHSHPTRFWIGSECQKCDPERRKNCGLAGANFFSAEDRFLHETVFPKAFQVGLVVTNAEDGIRHALFGWREGIISQRGFYILKHNEPFYAVEAKAKTDHEEQCPT